MACVFAREKRRNILSMGFLKKRMKQRTRRLLIAGFFCLLALAFATTWLYQQDRNPQYGITFSSVYAEELGLEPQAVFSSLLNEMDVRLVRLPVYWSEVEIEQGAYDWSEVDQLMLAAQRAGADVTMAIGQKVPRWPECFIPDWATALSDIERHEASAHFIEQVVQRYQSSSALYRWQVENEPFFPFGVCPEINSESVRAEVALVREIDPDHPIQMSTSGELEFWWQTAIQTDVLGFSLYRVTWNDVLGYSIYPFPPSFYRLRSFVARLFVDKVIVSELQAEPWFYEPIANKTLGEWSELFDEEEFKKNIQFVEEIGVSEVYLWGAEWWYLLKQEGYSELWDVAEELFSAQSMMVETLSTVND